MLKRWFGYISQNLSQPISARSDRKRYRQKGNDSCFPDFRVPYSCVQPFLLHTGSIRKLLLTCKALFIAKTGKRAPWEFRTKGTAVSVLHVRVPQDKPGSRPCTGKLELCVEMPGWDDERNLGGAVVSMKASHVSKRSLFLFLSLCLALQTCARRMPLLHWVWSLSGSCERTKLRMHWTVSLYSWQLQPSPMLPLSPEVTSWRAEKMNTFGSNGRTRTICDVDLKRKCEKEAVWFLQVEPGFSKFLWDLV